jgi:hypothetical protein
MKKLIAFAIGPWPLLLTIALSVVVFTAATIDWIYFPAETPALSDQEPAALPQIEEAQP